MTTASWLLGLNVIPLKNEEENKLAKTAFPLIVPWILISMFGGLGPPPQTAVEWTTTANEQQARYFMLVICGLFIPLGFAGLRDRLKAKGENFYSLLSLTTVLIAFPLFVSHMLYWGIFSE